MKHSQGHKIYSLVQWQWTTDDNGTEDAFCKRESSPTFAAASFINLSSYFWEYTPVDYT